MRATCSPLPLGERQGVRAARYVCSRPGTVAGEQASAVPWPPPLPAPAFRRPDVEHAADLFVGLVQGVLKFGEPLVVRPRRDDRSHLPAGRVILVFTVRVTPSSLAAPPRRWSRPPIPAATVRGSAGPPWPSVAARALPRQAALPIRGSVRTVVLVVGLPSAGTIVTTVCVRRSAWERFHSRRARWYSDS